ncbi:hypothetical protein MSSIT_0508 [Methanosarcina siciliae T4/M]|uniref:DUF2240 family protein n=2 Tax=Methanosarcina siciliae TaxID=38027 RepID=A0A0E3PAR2_9EURY|nr:DUF2240 family protein [Methanosarcina siciliae]AKB27227.1 hypothetical protein MSSIT_0508 [Methanosarcina siciliae T4/M]AKB31175.1 hypothetical protein MSSIH_0485 [Methanosarcina siciliae HI350]
MEELKRVVSAPFKKNLVASLPEKDFEFSLAFDLKWFSPKVASEAKSRAIEAGLLSLKDGDLSPGFEVESVRLPHAYKPPEGFLEIKEKTEKSGKSSAGRQKEAMSFEQILDFVSADTGLNRQRLVAEINSMQDRLSYLVDIRIVTLIVAKKFGCDIDGVIGKVSKAVLGSSDYT